MKDIIRQVKDQADRLGQCGYLNGVETLDELVEKLLSKQGTEFCCENNFPSMPTFAAFKQFDIDRLGVYINYGGMVISDRRRVVLVGRTSATINCGETDRYEVVLLHGAKAVVNASNWAVVRVFAAKGCEVIRNASNHAVIV